MKTIRLKSHQFVPKNYTGLVKWNTGSEEWYKNGKRHRTDGPAVEWFDGTRFWYKKGLPHREDGPAIEDFNGYIIEYWINGEKVEKEAMELFGWLFNFEPNEQQQDQ